MKNTIYFSGRLLFLLLLIGIMACSSAPSKRTSLKIAISKERKDIAIRYSNWLEFQKIPMTYLDLYSIPYDRLIDSLKTCDALILTGGEDIYPGLYGKEADTARCGDFNRYRDSLELILYKNAKVLNMPVLGICRGLQLINIAEGGSLYVDLPEDTKSGELHRIGIEDWALHYVVLSKGSQLNKVIGQDSIVVESNHHQGIDILAPSLQSLAISSDGLVEAVTGKDSKSGFLLAVQWHPEWAERTDEPSGKIARLFLEEAEKFRKSK